MTQANNKEQCCVTQCDRPLDQSFWNAQWQSEPTGWDIGHPAPAIKGYIDQYTNKDAAILIPGCGSAYEAEYLLAQGFTNIHLIDIAPAAVELLQQKFAGHPEIHVACTDYFHHVGKYDLIIEQTFFCAIAPERRGEYAAKAADLLREKGRIAGLLFDRKFEQPGPPFGGCPCEYKPVFEPYFDLKVMAKCDNSIAPRAGTELFILFIKKASISNEKIH